MVNEDVVRYLPELHLAFLHLAGGSTEAEATVMARSEQVKGHTRLHIVASYQTQRCSPDCR